MANPVASFFRWVGTKIAEAWAAAETLERINMVLSVVTLAVGVKGFMQARQMLAKGQDILANKTSAGGKIPVIYGTRRVGAQVIYMDVSNNDSRHLFVVYALSVGECDEILGRTIELDGNPITDPKRFRYGCYVGSDRNGETGYSGHRALNTVSQVGSTISAGAGGFGTSSTSRYRITFNLHHGEPTQSADPMLVASMPNWTSSHKLNGICYISAHYKYDKEGMFAGVPQLTVQVKGKRVYDPRDNTQTFGTPSTYKHSSNPALCFLDLISNNEYGKGLTASQLNMSTFSSAANVCDTKVDQPYFNGTAQSVTWSANSGDNFFTITGTGANDIWWQNKVDEIISIYDQNGDGVLTNTEITDIQRTEFFDTNQEFVIFINDYFSSNYSSVGGSTLLKVKRFHCNGYLDTNKNVMDNAKELLANMRGIFLYIDGQYELQIEDTGTSSFTITDDHIIADAGISVDYGNKDKKANKVIVEFFNANKRYELDTATVLHDATPEYYSDDGDEILEIKAEFPYVTDPYIAYNMAKAILTRSRKQMTIQFLGTPEMYKLNVGDIVTLNYVGTFDTSQTCRVEALELQPNGLVAVSLIEYFDVYTWETPPEEPLEELANLPSAYAVKAPTGLTFTDSSSSSTGRPILSWDAPTDYPDYEFRVNVVDSSGNQLMNRIVNTTFAELNFTPTGSNYVASVTSLNTLGTESDAETETFSVSDAPVGLGDIRADSVTANTIDVDELSAITANLGAIDAGSIDIGSGAFSVTSAGILDATGASIGGSFSAGSGNNIFKADSDGIYLGNATFANAPFKVLNTGAVQTTLSFTAGVAGTDAVAKMSGTGDYRFWSGNETPANASFSVDKDGKAVARNLVLKLTDGTVYFDSETGFSSSAISQISAVTGTKVNTISSTFDADTEYEEITVTANTTVNVSVSIDTNFGGTFGSSTESTAIDEAEAKVPANFTLTIEHSSDGGSNYNTVVTDEFTRVDTTPASDEYKINTFTDRIYISGGGGVIHLATTTTSFNLGCVDSDGRTVLSYTGLSLTGTTSGTTHRIRAKVSSTDTDDGTETGTPNYDATNNNVTSTAPRVVSVTDPSGNGFYVDGGSGSTVPPEGDITRVQITTAASSGLTGGANYTSGDALFTLALASSIDGAKTFTNNVVIQGDLDVQGTTTTIDTTNLDVKDKNITLNYGTGDTSANANGAGITIQDAVSAGNDATLTWNTSDDTFNLSHPLETSRSLTLNASGTNTTFIEVGANTSSNHFSYIDLIGDATYTDYGLRIIRNDSGANTSSGIYHRGTGDFNIEAQDSAQIKLRTSSADALTISSSGNVTIGGTDAGNKTLTISGGATGNAEGGEIRLATAADYDTTYDFYRIDVHQDNFRIGREGQTDLTINSSGNATFAGSITASEDIDVIMSGNASILSNAVGDYFPSLELKRTSGVSKTNYHWLWQIGSSGFLNLVDNTNSYYPVIFKNNGDVALSNDTDYTNPVLLLDKSEESATFAGNVTATAFYGDGSNLTGVSSTTINNNADNRIITGSATANTLNGESNLTFNGSTLGVTGSISIITGAVPLKFTESGYIGTGQFWRIPLDGGNLRFDVSTSGGGSFTTYDNVLQLNSNGSISVQGTQMFDSSGNINTTRTISSGAITTTGNIQQNNANEIRSKDTGGTVRTIMRVNSSNELEYGWSGNGKVKIMGGGSYTERFSIGTDGNATFAGTINSGAIVSTGDISGATIEGYTFPSYPTTSGSILRSTVDGTLSWTTNTVANYLDAADDRVLTSAGSTSIQGEYGLTYNRTDGLQIHNYDGTGGLSSDATLTLGKSNNNSGISELILDSQVSGFIKFQDGTTTDATVGYTGALTNKMSITCSNGINITGNIYMANNVGINKPSPVSELNVDGRLVLDAGTRSNPTGVNSALVIDYRDTGTDEQGRIRSRDWTGATWKNLRLEASEIRLDTEGTPALTLNTSQNATFAGTISSGAITSSGSVNATEVRVGNLVNNGTISANAVSGKQALTAKVANNGNSLFQGFNASDALITQITGTGALTHNGTISSGAINTSAKVTISNANYNQHLEISRTGQGTFGLTPSGNQLLIIGGGFSPSSNNAYDLGRTDKYWQDLWLGTSLKMAGTTVLDSSRNLIDIGTISSGNITVNGDASGAEGGEILLAGAGTNEGINIDNYNGIFRVFDGSAPAVRLQLDTNGNATFAGSVKATYSDNSTTEMLGYGIEFSRSASYLRPTTDGNATLYVGGADASLDWHYIDFKISGGLRVNGQQILSSARAMTNIASLTIDYTSNSASLNYGSSGSRTFTKNDAGASASQSGFFETASPTNYFSGATSWQHLMEARHSNNSNNYAMQIAGSFFNQNFYGRKTNNSATTAWSQFAMHNTVVTFSEVRSTGNVTAYYSDERLKDFTGKIDNAVDKVKQLNGYYFKENKKAKELGYDNDKQQVGVNAQEVQKVLPEVIDIAPISHTEGVDEEYLTVHYEKLVPLLIEAIKDQQKQIDELKQRLDNDSSN